MAAELLVEDLKDGGLELVRRLDRDGFDVDAAFLIRNDEDAAWRLYIASPSFDPENPGPAYRRVYSSLERIPDSPVSPSDVTLIRGADPIVRDAAAVRDRHPSRDLTRIHGGRLGNLPVADGWVFPRESWPRRAYRVIYFRERGDRWRASTERGERLEGVPLSGAVSYATDGESPGDARWAFVTVLLEVDPRLDERDLRDPGLDRAMARQASETADVRFQKYHPGATIEHEEPRLGPPFVVE